MFSSTAPTLATPPHTIPVSPHSLRHFVETLIAEETYEPEESVWLFADGQPCGICTTAAVRIAHTFHGNVMGYSVKANPTAQLGQPHIDGHDFALIADRFIVDYWGYRVAAALPKPVLDLHAPEDLALANRLYGDRLTWEVLAL